MKNMDYTFGRIGPKDWQEIFVFWQESIPSMQFPIEDFSATEESLLDNANTIGAQISDAEQKYKDRNHFFELSGIQYKIFYEAVSLYYKSLNALKSAQSDRSAGLKTWSIVNYYQASYYSIKCLLNLIGVHICRTASNRELLIDLFPTYGKVSSREYAAMHANGEVQIHLIHQLDHWELWKLLQRAIRVSRNLPFNDKLLDCLTAFEGKSFAKQRNRIIYHDSSWLFEDLRSELENASFEDFDFENDDESSLNEHESFTMAISTMVSAAAHRLFEEIANNNPSFREEFDIMLTGYGSSNNSDLSSYINRNGILFDKAYQSRAE